MSTTPRRQALPGRTLRMARDLVADLRTSIPIEKNSDEDRIRTKAGARAGTSPFQAGAKAPANDHPADLGPLLPGSSPIEAESGRGATRVYDDP